MRLLKIGVYYPEYLKHFYSERPHLASQPYAHQHAALMDDCFGSSDFWTKALTARDYETADLIMNAEPMQKAWATEAATEYDDKNWVFSVTAAQVEMFKPDVLLVADYTTVTSEFLRHLRERCPSIRLVLCWCGAPYSDGAIFEECDIVLSCVPELVKHFKEGGRRSHHVNHAFDARILAKLDEPVGPLANFVFLGSIVMSRRFHREREALIRKLVAATNLQIWSKVSTGDARQNGSPAIGSEERNERFVVRRALKGIARRAGGFLQVAGKTTTAEPVSIPLVDQHIVDRALPPLFGLKMFQQLRSSRVALNTHIDISPISASNMRLFEATGVGTCLLTDWKANLPQLFKPDAEIVSYRDANECIEKVKYLLENESERLRIAAAGQRRTLRDHTFQHRAAQIDDLIRKSLAIPS